MRDLWDFSRQLLSGPDPQMANVKIGREALCPTDNAEMYAMTMTLPEPDLMGIGFASGPTCALYV